ncbi:MAG: helix-turn-helix domain-containing protein [Tsuneonella suprasediminis]
MESDDKFAAVDMSIFREIKLLSGERIRCERNRLGITQFKLATNLGASPRWMREIEAGAPATKLEDHLKATLSLGMLTGHIALPILFAGHRMRFPRQLVYGDLLAIERQCIEVISESVLTGLKQDLSPEWRQDDESGSDMK